MWTKYGKAIASVVGAGLMVAYGALSGDQRIEQDEAVQVAIAIATAVGVYLVPLAPQYRWGKTAVAVVLSVLQALTTVIIGGLDASEWIALALAALTVVGVQMAPATSDNGIGHRSPVAPRTAGRSESPVAGTMGVRHHRGHARRPLDRCRPTTRAPPP